MKSKKESNSSDPWASMNRFFNGAFPFSGSPIPTDLMKNSEWLERMAQETFTQSNPTPSQSKELYSHNIFETHRSVIVRIQLPQSVNPEFLRVYVGPTSARVEGLSNPAEKKVQLPCEVNRVGIRSSYKDGILEIRMKKNYDSKIN